MSRRKNGGLAEDIVTYASHLPWWLCMILALISFLIFNHISHMPDQAITAGHAGDHLARTASSIFASFAKLIVPSLMVLAGIVSIIKRKQGQEPDERQKIIAYIMLGIITILLTVLFFLFSMIGRSTGDMFDNINKNAEASLEKAKENQQSQR